MIESMTAFARQERSLPWGRLSWEIRSVNHRYLDLGIRLPEECRDLEQQIRTRVAEPIGRGKVDLTLRLHVDPAQQGLRINDDLARELARACQQVATHLDEDAPVNPLDLLRWPGIAELGVVDADTLSAEALGLLDGTLEELKASRRQEGTRLAQLVQERVNGIRGHLDAIRERLPQISEQLRDRLRERIAELGVEADPARLEQELALQAVKLDVSEELDRLAAHLDEVERVLQRGGPAGRRLDFLMQELNREANTLGSKSLDTDTRHAGVEIKVLIEQIREQVQNIA